MTNYEKTLLQSAAASNAMNTALLMALFTHHPDQESVVVQFANESAKHVARLETTPVDEADLEAFARTRKELLRILCDRAGLPPHPDTVE
jgi:hypothetical protein